MKKYASVLSLLFLVSACGHFPTAKRSSKLNSHSTKLTLKSPTRAMTKSLKVSSEDKLYFELAGEKLDKLNESALYKKVIEKYRNRDLRALSAFTNALIAKYPQSIYADNSLYLCGNLAQGDKQFGRALELYNQLLLRYPNSNKAVSALYAKGLLYKQMNLTAQAQTIFKQVRSRYPGSSEAIRSDVESRMLK